MNDTNKINGVEYVRKGKENAPDGQEQEIPLLFPKVIEVFETSDIKTVNKLIAENWIVLNVLNVNSFSLGRIL